jgi:hypothetical protein
MPEKKLYIMRFFDESTATKAKETLVLLNLKEAEIIIDAMEEYVKNNKRKSIAKNLLKEMNEKWGIY